MKRIRDGNEINARPRLHAGFRGSIAHNGLGNLFAKFCGHARVRFNGDNFAKMRYERARRFSCARAQVHGTVAARGGHGSEDVFEKLAWIIWPITLEFFSGVPKAGLEHRGHEQPLLRLF